MTLTNDGRCFVWAVFDADGCECETLSAVFGSESEALGFAARFNASAEAEYDELYRDSEWKPSIKRIVSTRQIELGKEPDISSTLALLRENRPATGAAKADDSPVEAKK